MAKKRVDMVSQMAGEPVLWAAWARVACGTHVPGVDGVTLEAYGRHLGDRLAELSELLRSGAYRCQPLKPLTAQRSGKVRHLALPTVRDRVAQRAFLEVAGRRLDIQAAEASFAYRKGRSWLDALAKAERCRDQGLRFVMRADIESFFDRIDHSLLGHALQASIGDTRAVALALDWSAAPVLGANGIEPRPLGVPQGAPVSPALANAYLAGFDREMEGRRGRLVRYADDIAVFCADPDAAEAARLDVETTLGRLRLQANAAKTYVSSFDRGFSFLGWVFFRDAGYEEMPGDRWIHPMAAGRPGRQPGQAGRTAALRPGWG